MRRLRHGKRPGARALFATNVGAARVAAWKPPGTEAFPRNAVVLCASLMRQVLLRVFGREHGGALELIYELCNHFR